MRYGERRSRTEIAELMKCGIPEIIYLPFLELSIISLRDIKMRTWSWLANSIEPCQTARMYRLAWLYWWQRLITFGSSRIRVKAVVVLVDYERETLKQYTIILKSSTLLLYLYFYAPTLRGGAFRFTLVRQTIRPSVCSHIYKHRLHIGVSVCVHLDTLRFITYNSKTDTDIIGLKVSQKWYEFMG